MSSKLVGRVLPDVIYEKCNEPRGNKGRAVDQIRKAVPRCCRSKFAFMQLHIYREKCRNINKSDHVATLLKVEVESHEEDNMIIAMLANISVSERCTTRRPC